MKAPMTKDATEMMMDGTMGDVPKTDTPYVFIRIKAATPQIADKMHAVPLALFQYRPKRIGQKKAHSSPPMAKRLIHTIRSGG